MLVILIDIVGVAVLFALDQAIKAWATAFLAPVGAVAVLPGIVELRYVLNNGAAFSMLSGRQGILIAVTGAALLAIAYMLFFRSKKNALRRISLVLVLGGGLGNFFDRVLHQQVVDYINPLFMRFAVFNFADICVCVGVGLLILCMLLETRETDKR